MGRRDLARTTSLRRGHWPLPAAEATAQSMLAVLYTAGVHADGLLFDKEQRASFTGQRT